MRGLDHLRADPDLGGELSRLGQSSKPGTQEGSEAIDESNDIKELALLCALACEEKKGEDVKVLDVREALPILDYFVIATGRNRRHLRSMADSIRQLLREKGREVPKEEGGEDGGRWLLLDFGDAIVHLFDRENREYYDLDGLWADVPRVQRAAG